MKPKTLWWGYGLGVGFLWLVSVLVITQIPAVNPYYNAALGRVVPTAIPMTQQVIVIRSIRAGTTITRDMIALFPVTVENSVRGGYVDLDSLVGTITNQDIFRSQVITENMLQNPPPSADVRATATASTEAATATPYMGAATITPITVISGVVLAQVDIPAGSVITNDDITTRYHHFPETAVQFNVAIDYNDVVGKVARTNLPRDYPILTSTLVDANDPDRPTPIPVPGDSCYVTTPQSSYVTLYRTPAYTQRDGYVRSQTDAVVIERQGDFYLLELPGGVRLGWVERGQVTLQGACDDIR